MTMSSTDLTMIRLLVADTDATAEFFSDEQIEGFYDMAASQYTNSAAVRWAAAAMALRVGAINQVFVKGKTSILDTVNVDGASEADSLRRLADNYDQKAKLAQGRATGFFFEVIVPS